MDLLNLIGVRRNDGRPALLDDLRSGAVGAWVRIGLSLAALGAAIAGVMFFLGIIEFNDVRVGHGAIMIGVAAGGACWCVAMVWLWASYRRWQRALRTAFAVLAVWAVVLPVIAVLVDHHRGEHIAIGLAATGIASTIALISTAGYRGPGGAPVVDRKGRMRVHCPECGYSLVGLESCTCPECGAAFTIDELLGRQDYMPRLAAAQGADDEGPGETPDVADAPPVSA